MNLDNFLEIIYICKQHSQQKTRGWLVVGGACLPSIVSLCKFLKSKKFFVHFGIAQGWYKALKVLKPV